MPRRERAHGAWPLAREGRDGKARRGRPGSQETCLRPKAHKPSWKGVGSMHLSRRISLRLGAALASAIFMLALACVATASAGPTVTVRVEGESATLLPPTTVTLNAPEPVSGCSAD